VIEKDARRNNVSFLHYLKNQTVLVQPHGVWVLTELSNVWSWLPGVRNTSLRALGL